MRKMSEEGRAALSKARKGKKPSPAQLESLAKARASRTTESFARQAASLSATARGRPRSPAQVAVLDAARSKAHSNMLGQDPDRVAVYGLFASIGPSLRKRDGDLCQLCLQPINFNLPIRTPWSRSVDHIVPVRAGGSDDPDNLWLSHLICNMKKGARHVGRADGSTDRRS